MELTGVTVGVIVLSSLFAECPGVGQWRPTPGNLSEKCYFCLSPAAWAIS